MKHLLVTYWPACIIGTFLLGFTVDFFARFVWRAVRLRRTIEESIRRVQEFRKTARGAVIHLDTIAEKAMTTDCLAQLWHEYAKTLHPQREADELGQSRIVRWRSTALAEIFFTGQALIDSPLDTDYFKHLPGILTGLGIIGTFLGLIRGLSHFVVSADAVEQSLQILMHAVGDAFYVSGTAISLAILLTSIEKPVLSGLYHKLERLRQAIDALFATGADDEYLERIVKASETSATQAVQLKDALVSDLRQILTDITAKQMAASAQHSNMISADVGKAITGTLAPIAQAFETVRANQGDAVSKLLVDVLSNFSHEVREMFGGSMETTQQLLQTTNTALESTAGRLEQLAVNTDHASDAMADRLTQAILGMEARQEIFNQQMTEVVEQLRTTTKDSQHEAAGKMQEIMAALGENLGALVERVQGQVSTVADRQEAQTGRVLGSMSTQMEHLIAESVKTNQSLQASVSVLASCAGDSVAKMQTGAELLGGASDDLARTATRVADALRLAGGTVESMREAAESLSVASVTTGQVSAEYARSRDVFAGMIGDLKSTVENARREASLTDGVLARLKGGADELGLAQKQAENYLAEINSVLGGVHQAFAANIETTLHHANGEFQRHVSEAVGHLASAIQDLAAEQIPARR